MVGQQKKLMSRTSKTPFLSGKGRHKPPWLISFKKIQSHKLFLQAKGKVNNLVLTEEQK